jgi:hypothetical protein
VLQRKAVLLTSTAAEVLQVKSTLRSVTAQKMFFSLAAGSILLKKLVQE